MHFNLGSLALPAMLLCASQASAEWVGLGPTYRTGSCGHGCGSLVPGFSESSVRDYMAKIMADPCGKWPMLFSDGKFGTLTFVPSTAANVQCQGIAPMSVEAGYDRFNELIASPGLAWGKPGGARAAQAAVMNQDGVAMGQLAITGACIPFVPLPGIHC